MTDTIEIFRTHLREERLEDLTMKAYIADVKQALEIIGKPATDIERTDILDYLDHIEKKYPYAVQKHSKSLPTVNVGRRDHGKEKYYLANQVDVLSDQVYRRALTPTMTSGMIDFARRSPRQTTCVDVGRRNAASSGSGYCLVAG